MKLLTGSTSSSLIFGASALLDNHGFLLARTESPDNTCGTTGSGGSSGAYTCPSALPCCSSNGYCGNNSTYCVIDSGCQTAYGTCDNATTTPGEDNLCGPSVGSCDVGQCCSAAGYCGTTEEYCEAPDCQAEYGPACDQNLSPSGTNTSTVARTQIGSVAYGGDGIYNCVNAGDMALTFDDGPYIYTDHILDLLAQYNASATFMVTGMRTASTFMSYSLTALKGNNLGKGEIDDASKPWAGIIKRMYSEGHQIASHTWSHQDLCNITSAERKNEMYKNEMALNNILGVFPTYMRPPYSSCTAECGCASDMADLGYHIIYFDVDTQDYLHDDPTEIQTSKDIFTTAMATGNSTAWGSNDFLVIGHDIHNQTANNLTEFMLQNLLAGGYRPVTVGECLGDDKANWYRTG